MVTTEVSKLRPFVIAVALILYETAQLFSLLRFRSDIPLFAHCSPSLNRRPTYNRNPCDASIPSNNNDSIASLPQLESKSVSSFSRWSLTSGYHLSFILPRYWYQYTEGINPKNLNAFHFFFPNCLAEHGWTKQPRFRPTRQKCVHVINLAG